MDAQDYQYNMDMIPNVANIGVDDDEVTHENFMDYINTWDFYGDSSTTYMHSIEGKRHSANMMLKMFLKGTYFERLPLELVQMIFEYDRQNEINMDRMYYANRYFAPSETDTECARYLRPTREQHERALQTGEVTYLTAIQTPLGVTFGRRILKNNTVGRINYAFRAMFKTMKQNKAKGIDMFFKLITTYMLWIVHHSFQHEWYTFMKVIYSKCAEFAERLAMFEVIDFDGEIPKELATPKMRARVWEKIYKIKYFLEQYVPYALLSQSDSFYASAEMCVSPDFISTLLFDIYTMTGFHPNSIDLRVAREFEMEIYAPKYYHETYENYMKLRSGRRLIPSGEIPEFYWCADKYIQRFI